MPGGATEVAVRGRRSCEALRTLAGCRRQINNPDAARERKARCEEARRGVRPAEKRERSANHTREVTPYKYPPPRMMGSRY